MKWNGVNWRGFILSWLLLVAQFSSWEQSTLYKPRKSSYKRIGMVRQMQSWTSGRKGWYKITQLFFCWKNGPFYSGLTSSPSVPSSSLCKAFPGLNFRVDAFNLEHCRDDISINFNFRLHLRYNTLMFGRFHVQHTWGCFRLKNAMVKQYFNDSEKTRHWMQYSFFYLVL